MKMKVKTVKQIRVAAHSIKTRLQAVQGDSGRVIELIITDVEIPSSATARIYALKPDGKEIYNNCTVSGQTVTINLTTQLLTVAGTARCQVEIKSGNDIITTFAMDLNIEKSYVSSSAIESKDEFNAITKALDKVDELNENLANLFPGGTNILRNTNIQNSMATGTPNWSQGLWRDSVGTNAGNIVQIEIADAPNPDIKFGYRLTKDSGAAAFTLYQSNIPIQQGQQYTVSCYARVISGTPTIQLSFTASTERPMHTGVGNEWKRIATTFRVTSGNMHVHFGLQAATTGAIEICGMKLELGNKATDWSPSPWDIARHANGNYITDTSWTPVSLNLNIGESRNIVCAAAVTSVITEGQYSIALKGTIYRVANNDYDFIGQVGSGSVSSTLVTVRYSTTGWGAIRTLALSQ